MARKKRKSSQKKEPIAEIHFNQIDYDILELSYGYTFTQNPIFMLTVKLKVPDELFDQAIVMGLPLSEIFPILERNHLAMVNYVKKTIEGFDDPHFNEELAFKALEAEGFDLENFARCALEDLKVELSWDPDVPPPTPQVKTVRFDTIDYKIENVQISYGDDEEAPVFTFHVTVQLPKHILDQVICINMPLHKMWGIVEKQDVSMSNYAKKAFEDNQNEPEHEILTVQSLVAEGFDLHRFLKFALADFEFQVEKK
ncbi:MAG: hypothetical protein JNL70_27710 [Saprospiraceae bacterium]|nr:hypothetical protein [Saprospiraceae bacterium]